MPDPPTKMVRVPPATTSVPVTGPLDLRATLRPLHGVFDSEGWWLPARTPEGPGTLRIRRTPDAVVGEAWGDGAEWLLHRLPGIAGLADDPSTFITDHPLVGEVHRRRPGWRFGRSALVFDSLVVAIAEQKVTGIEARAAVRGLRARFGDAAPGPNPRLRLPPDPQRMAAAPYWEYHELHLERRRAEVIRRVAAVSARVDGLRDLAPAAASEWLLRIPGIGPWSVAKTLAVSHGDADQVEVGDFHLKHTVVFHLTGRPRGSDEEMLELLEPFRPHRGRVARLLHSLGHEPKFGPRSTPRDITRI